MSLPSSRVLTGLSTPWLKRGSAICRYKSTTSSIRAGLRAEQGLSSYGGRDRSTRPRGGADRSGGASLSARSERRDNYPSLERRGLDSGRSSFRSRDSPPSRYERAPAGRNSTRLGRDRGSAPSLRSSSFRQRTDADGRIRSHNSSSFREHNDAFARAARSQGSDSRQALTDDSGAEILSRKERRARFWAENAPAEGGLDDFQADDQPQRNPVRLPQHHLERTRDSGYFHSRDDDDNVPMPVPYTTASSQFIYGANTVLAALRAVKRKIYRLYMHKRSEAENIAQIRRTASGLGIDIVRTADTVLLDRLSEGRPHNGVVLEVSHIPARPVLTLQKWNERAGMFALDLAEQDAEEAAVNGTETKMWKVYRSPLVVFLDGITDPGNVGNIIRTAHFFGADAVAIATQTCASISSPVLAKASAGACEAVPIFAVPHASGFVFNSRREGWTICAAVAPADLKTDPQSKTRQHLTTQQMAVESPLAGKPTILMLGAEGEGLRDNLRKKADVFVTIAERKTARDGLDAGVDSLNVATAAALLINAFASGSQVSPYHAKPGKGETELGI